MQQHQVIRRPLITEKATTLREGFNQYLFEVDREASKHQIAEAVEGLFKVKVNQVKTLRVRGKVKRVGRHIGKRPNWKKAYVTLVEGQKIGIFEA